MGRGASCGVRTSRRTRSTGQPQGYRADVPLGALQTAADRRIGRSDDRRLFMVSLSNQLRRCAISAALLGGSRNAWTGKLEMIRGVTATLPSCGVRSWATKSWPLHSSIACYTTVISSTYVAAATACASTSTFPRSYTRLLRSRALHPLGKRAQEQRRKRRTRGSSPPPKV